MEQHFIGKVATKAIITKGDEVLMTRRNKDSEIFDLPGGRINRGESIEAALKREIDEELGAEIKVGDLICSEQVFHKEDGSSILFVTLTATLIQSNPSFKVPSEELAEIKWINKDMIEEIKTYDNCTRALKTYWKLS